MEGFYRWRRRTTGVLMDGEAPAGGRFNFDHDNRHRPTDDLARTGFVRQILGWREFVRNVYRRWMPGYARGNHLDAPRFVAASPPVTSEPPGAHLLAPRGAGVTLVVLTDEPDATCCIC